MDILCLKCKGRRYCHRNFCAIQAKAQSLYKSRSSFTSPDFSGSSPSIFVGYTGYPFLNVGILSAGEIKADIWKHDAPRHWSAKSYDIQSIVDFRSGLVNSRQKEKVKGRSRFLDTAKEIAMARSADLEINLKKLPRFQTSFEAIAPPMGPTANVRKVEIISNPKIPRKVDKVVSDTDLYAALGIEYLYSKGFEENTISKILSIGNMGLGRNRKLVPTRWSITAVDDQLGKTIIQKIKTYPVSDHLAFFGGHLGNYFLIMLFPEVWSYELFEMYMPNVSWNVTAKLQYMTDHEFYTGRTSYAKNCAGGYYASRLPILDELKHMKRQSTVLVLRFITGEYAVPLGVWVVREAVRKAMQKKPIAFASMELMLDYARLLVKKKFNCDMSGIMKKSKVLDNMGKQSKLERFI